MYNLRLSVDWFSRLDMTVEYQLWNDLWSKKKIDEKYNDMKKSL